MNELIVVRQLAYLAHRPVNPVAGEPESAESALAQVIAITYLSSVFLGCSFVIEKQKR